jgi:hypothetical protein
MTSGASTRAATGTTAAPAPATGVTAIRAAQAAVVSQAHQGPVTAAQAAVDSDQLAKADDANTLSSDQSTLATETAAVDQAGQRLSSDQNALAAATAANASAQAQLQSDRARLRNILVGLYAGADSGPPPAGTAPLALIQADIYGEAEATIVVNGIVKDLRVDVQLAAADSRRQTQLTSTVSRDTATLANDRQLAAQTTTRVASDSASLSQAAASLAADRARLAGALATQHAAVVAVVGPALPGAGLSVLGASALSPTQLAAWFNANGFADLTVVPIGQLAGWYVQQGTLEGVRGDVAFAQAVLETGGFISSDAVTLNNYAGIGHCDTCAQGWALPSPQGGVLGQLQLLRIFAAGRAASRPGLPAPVLPALTPAHEARQGCCQTWESLTGVWATDPSYASSILSLYQQMLTFAENTSAGTDTTPTA